MVAGQERGAAKPRHRYPQTVESASTPGAISPAGLMVRALVTVGTIAALALAVVNRHWVDAAVVVVLIVVGLILRRNIRPVQISF